MEKHDQMILDIKIIKLMFHNGLLVYTPGATYF